MTKKMIENTSDNNNSQKRGWIISNVNTPGEGSDIILLKLSSELSLIAFRNDGTKNVWGCIVYISLCKGCISTVSDSKSPCLQKDNNWRARTIIGEQGRFCTKLSFYFSKFKDKKSNIHSLESHIHPWEQ